jgi:hypothetical protein
MLPPNILNAEPSSALTLASLCVNALTLTSLVNTSKMSHAAALASEGSQTAAADGFAACFESVREFYHVFTCVGERLGGMGGAWWPWRCA